MDGVDLVSYVQLSGIACVGVSLAMMDPLVLGFFGTLLIVGSSIALGRAKSDDSDN